MITNKDIRVENGSLIINGDPYPLDGQSPEAIMQIVEDNSDTTPTVNSTAPITSGGVYAAIGDLTATGVTGVDVASQIGVLNTGLSNLIKYQYVDTLVASMSPGITTVSIPLTIPSGYTCIGVLQALTSSTLVAVSGAYIDTANSALKINCSNSQPASSVTIAATVLYIKS